MTSEKPRILPKQSVPTRDHVELCADVYLPKTDDPRPAVVVQTPYGRSVPFLLYLALRLSQAGYCAILQDCRGRRDSGGEYDWRRAADDGYDTLVWLKDQPWCDGTVGLIGLSTSAHGFATLAARQPPAGIEIAAMASIMGAFDLHRSFYRDGALVLHWALPWLIMAGSAKEGPRTLEKKPWDKLFDSPTASEVAGTHKIDPDLWRQALSSPDGGAFWQGLGAAPELASVRTPTLLISGWYDLMLDQTLLGYQKFAAAGGPHPKLLIGPWHHNSLIAWSPGGATLDQGERRIPDILGFISAWFDSRFGQHRQEIPAAKAKSKDHEVQLYVMGQDRWLGLERFTEEQGAIQDWYLSPGGDARGEAGRLSRQAPEEAAGDSFTYDPADPVPTRGGALWPLRSAKLVAGRADQSEIERRSDVLVYTSPPLDDDLVVAGRLEVELWATSSAAATDFTATLVDVDLRGVPFVVQDGIARYRAEASPETAEPPLPRPRRLSIDLQATGQCFKRGHRIRLLISSSNFPKFDRGLNRSPNRSDDDSGAPAEQTVFRGGPQASRLRLPVVSAERLLAGRTDPFETRADPREDATKPWRARLSARFRRGTQRLQARLLDVVSSQFGKPQGFLGRVAGGVLARANREINEWTVSQLDLSSEHHVLEIGFGPGMTIRQIAEVAVDGLVAGIDHSEVMVSRARRRNRKAVGEGRVELKHGSVESLPYGDEAFDRVVAVNSVQVWPDRPANLREVRRVMKPEATIALTLQPRWARTPQMVREIGVEIVGDVTAAGFGKVRLTIRPTQPIPTLCVLAVKPPNAR